MGGYLAWLRGRGLQKHGSMSLEAEASEGMLSFCMWLAGRILGTRVGRVGLFCVPY